jgi:hypothetical protein
MAVMARAAGLPSRLVVGFASGSYDPINNRYVVTEADAHSWVEIYFTGRGWVEFEPTASLPIIQRLAMKLEMGALVIAPTRELAQQIASMFDDLGRSSGIRVAVVVGGIPIEKDYKALRHWPNVLVATPGRLIDHIRSRTIVLTHVEVLVIDEADRMHDMGFIPQIRQILQHRAEVQWE